MVEKLNVVNMNSRRHIEVARSSKFQSNIHISNMTAKCFPTLTGLLQVLNANIVHREERCRGSVLRTHVGNGGSISDGQLSHTGAKKLHKLPHYTHLTEVLKVQVNRKK